MLCLIVCVDLGLLVVSLVGVLAIILVVVKIRDCGVCLLYRDELVEINVRILGLLLIGWFKRTCGCYWVLGAWLNCAKLCWLHLV